jgi:hypothetical protein
MPGKKRPHCASGRPAFDLQRDVPPLVKKLKINPATRIQYVGICIGRSTVPQVLLASPRQGILRSDKFASNTLHLCGAGADQMGSVNHIKTWRRRSVLSG